MDTNYLLDKYTQFIFGSFQLFKVYLLVEFLFERQVLWDITTLWDHTTRRRPQTSNCEMLLRRRKVLLVFIEYINFCQVNCFFGLCIIDYGSVNSGIGSQFKSTTWECCTWKDEQKTTYIKPIHKMLFWRVLLRFLTSGRLIWRKEGKQVKACSTRHVSNKKPQNTFDKCSCCSLVRTSTLIVDRILHSELLLLGIA